MNEKESVWLNAAEIYLIIILNWLLE